LQNDCIGSKAFKVRAICKPQLTKRVIPIQYKEEKSGDVLLETKFSSAEPEKVPELGSEEEEFIVP
jgi:hypothetical protein